MDGWYITHNNHYYEILVRKIYEVIENRPHVIKSPNPIDTIHVNQNVDFCKKKRKLLEIYIRELYNYLVLYVTNGGLSGACEKLGKVCIGETSLKKCANKHIKTIRNKNNITCDCETCISSILLQS